MSDIEERPNDFRYFFMAYTLGGGIVGNLMLKQNKESAHYAENGRADNCMNISSATQYLMEVYRCPCVVTFWQEMTYKRYVDWKVFLKTVPDMFSEEQKKKFGVVDGGGETSGSAPLTGLHVVKAEETPPAV